MKTTTYTNNCIETMALGEALGAKLAAGDVIALFGDLGAGKTTLTKGIAEGMNLPDDIHSPTFTLIHEHLGAVPLYHVDLYRLASEDDVESIGIEEYIYGHGVTIIEWADRMKTMLPPERLDIEIRMTGDETRDFTFETESPRLWTIIKELTGC
ncbi:MAG: tRNA (adenosine(37)-N6)-threonylcarbamoyltransferase complex ATPase subunit type 1 TsaE [Armatimonadetes bacterium]|nr:tRNA (adenosine(37)-N6)-threonylcarbamoyltransferase complex ATPase subunit type 1 TsaE [Armatimonadota bacterium]